MITYFLTECGEEVKQKCEKDFRQIVPTNELFHICKIVNLKGNSKRRVEQMSWESFVKDARRLKKDRTNIGKENQQQIKQVQSKRQSPQLWNKRQNKQTASIVRPRTRASL